MAETDLITTLNLVNGQVAKNPRNYLDVYDNLVEVAEDTKSFSPTKYKAMSKSEYIAWAEEKAARRASEEKADEKAAADAEAAAKQAAADQEKAAKDAAEAKDAEDAKIAELAAKPIDTDTNFAVASDDTKTAKDAK